MTNTEHSSYIDTADVAKLIRKQLKKHFPNTKFSVRIDRYSGGSSIDIFWTDGPTEHDVRHHTDAFAGGRFDGRTDCPFHARSWYCPDHGARVAETYGADLSDNNDVGDSRCCANAELVDFLADFVVTHRELSDELTAAIRVAVLHDAGLDLDDTSDSTPLPNRSAWKRLGNDTIRDGIWRASQHTPA